MKSPKLLLVAFCLLLSAAGTFAAPITTPPTQGPKAMGQARWWDQLQEADGLANQGDWPMAILRLQELLPQVPPPVRAMIHLRLASIFANQKDWDRAVQNGHLAIEAAPANGWVYLPVVKILHAADRDEEAVALCQDAAKNDPAVTQASLDLIKEIKRGHPLRKYFLLWLLLALGGGAAGASFL
ncbi:MAG: tetratricopeptide repeat protein, partial [Bacteroidota bacterium]